MLLTILRTRLKTVIVINDRNVSLTILKAHYERERHFLTVRKFSYKRRTIIHVNSTPVGLTQCLYIKPRGKKKRDRNIIRFHTGFKQQKFWLYTYSLVCNHMTSRNIYTVHSKLLHKPQSNLNILSYAPDTDFYSEWVKNEYILLPRKSKSVLRLGTR
jgi:hypothetical protein